MSWIEKGWYSKNPANYLLLPLTAVFWLLSSLRKGLFTFGIKQQNKFKVPVLVVGNISVGGTGKTPFVIYLTELFAKKGIKVGIVSRGYGAEQKSPFPRIIKAQSDTKYAGDEPKLLAMRTQVPVVIAPDRSQAIQQLVEQHQVDLIISDDGLQHYRMARDIEVVLLDAERMLGNGWLLPTGPLRESKARLDSVDLVVKNGGFNCDEDYSLSPGPAYQLSDKTNVLTNVTQNKVHLVSGIGNPKRFEDTVKQTGFEIASTSWFADHHPFSEQDFVVIENKMHSDDIILMTEKDAVKCQHFAKQNWFVLPIDAKISPALEERILTIIKNKTNLGASHGI